MAETAPVATPAKTPVKKQRASKPKGEKKPITHPSYNDMVVAAIKALAERGGSSRQAISKYILANYKVGTDANQVNTQIKLALKRAVIAQKLKNSKGKGASGSFKITESGKTALKQKEKDKVKKAKAAAKKATAKKAPATTVKKVKKPAATTGKKEKKAKPSGAVKEKKPRAKPAAAKPKASPSKPPKSPAAKKPKTPKATKAAKVVKPKSSPKKKAPAAKKAKTPKKVAAAKS